MKATEKNDLIRRISESGLLHSAECSRLGIEDFVISLISSKSFEINTDFVKTYQPRKNSIFSQTNAFLSLIYRTISEMLEHISELVESIWELLKLVFQTGDSD